MTGVTIRNKIMTPRIKDFFSLVQNENTLSSPTNTNEMYNDLGFSERTATRMIMVITKVSRQFQSVGVGQTPEGME